MSLQNAESGGSEDEAFSGAESVGGHLPGSSPSGGVPTGGVAGTTSGGGTGATKSGASVSGVATGLASAGGGSAGADSADGSWASIINELDLQGAARQLASHCVLDGRQPGIVRLAIDPSVKFVRTTAQEEKLAQALSRYYGETVRLEFTTAGNEAQTPAQAEQRASQQELEVARQAFETDPGVKGLRERFGATLLPNTIRPVK